MKSFLTLTILLFNFGVASNDFKFELDNQWLDSKESQLILEDKRARGRLDISSKDYIDFNFYKKKYGKDKGKINSKIEFKTPLGKLRISR